MLEEKKNFLNVRKDKSDPRDWKFSKGVAAPKLPTGIDYRPFMPTVVDQGNLGSCTGNAIAGAYQYDMIKQKLNVFAPSRLFIYYNERLFEGTVNFDSGAYIRDGIKSLYVYGVCPEATWPYNISQFKTKPSDLAYSQAAQHKALAYYRVNVTLNDIKGALAAGFPVIIGYAVYESFMTANVARNGMMPMPGPRESILGGHAVLIVGYNDSTQRFICRNSWGYNWGDKGHFYMPYAYANPNLMNDLWVVSSVK